MEENKIMIDTPFDSFHLVETRFDIERGTFPMPLGVIWGQNSPVSCIFLQKIRKLTSKCQKLIFVKNSATTH